MGYFKRKQLDLVEDTMIRDEQALQEESWEEKEMTFDDFLVNRAYFISIFTKFNTIFN